MVMSISLYFSVCGGVAGEQTCWTSRGNECAWHESNCCYRFSNGNRMNHPVSSSGFLSYTLQLTYDKT